MCPVNALFTEVKNTHIKRHYTSHSLHIMSMILKDFLMGDFNDDKTNLHSEMHKENRQELSPPQKTSPTLFLP